jgi:hypothetical protein
MKNPSKTFNWIVAILRKHQVPFVISGGLAAKAYGSPRPLNDIDIDIPNKCFVEILEDISPYIVYGPARLTDERWDCELLTLNHEGQDIDLSGGDDLKICDARTGEWKFMPTNFADTEQLEIFGLKVLVISRAALVEYKSMLDGKHQQVDIQALKRPATAKEHLKI